MVILSRLWTSGLFADVDLAPSSRDRVLNLHLRENPFLSRGTLRGLRENSPDALLARLLGAADSDDDGLGESANSLQLKVWRKHIDSAPAERGCANSPPDPHLYARIEGGAWKSGILRGGLEAAKARALDWLSARGYPHASVALSVEDGAALIDIDEGRIDSLELRGIHPSIQAEVQRTLALPPGEIFSNLSLRRAVDRLRERYPFLDLDVDRATGELPGDVRPFAQQLRAGRADLGPLFLSWSYRDSPTAPPPDEDPGPALAGNSVEVLAPGRYLLWLKTKAASIDLDWIQLLRHTPATGFAPALAATVHLWDSRDHAHLALDGDFAANSKRSAQEAPAGSGLFERMSAQQEVDGLFGARLSIPSLYLAEVGGQIYALTDTFDTWRMGDLSSYVHSALLAQPDREYFRRAGATFLLTFHLFDRLTLGTEVHHDRYDALPNPKTWSLVHDGDPPQPTAPVTPGEFGSILLRAEYSSDAIQLAQVGKLFRHPETSLAEHTSDALFRSFATLEIGNSALGGDPNVSYLHLVSDSRVQLALPHEVLARVRLRVGLGNGLPLQKEEALGGWSALRGYDFKEFRGDASILGNLEARWRFLGAFFDLGAVHQASWTQPKPGIGGQLILDKIGSLDFAWRLDGHGDAKPTARALLGWDI